MTPDEEREAAAKNDREDDDRVGPVTAEEAADAALRFINGHFNNPGKDRPRISIPCRPDRDDDVRLMAFIRRSGTALDEARSHIATLEAERDEAREYRRGYLAIMNVGTPTLDEAIAMSTGRLLSEADTLRSQVASLTAERDEARADIEAMLVKASDLVGDDRGMESHTPAEAIGRVVESLIEERDEALRAAHRDHNGHAKRNRALVDAIYKVIRGDGLETVDMAVARLLSEFATVTQERDALRGVLEAVEAEHAHARIPREAWSEAADARMSELVAATDAAIKTARSGEGTP